MPTYTNPNTTPYVEAGVHIAAGETKETPLTLTEIIVTLPSVVAGLGLELVTETGSGATGRIYWINGTEVGLVQVSGTFTGEAALTGDVTGAMGTPAAGALVVVLTRDVATGFYSALLNQTTVTASGAGTEDVYLTRGSTWVVVVASTSDVVVKTSSGDVIMPLLSGKVWQDYNNSRYEHLKLTFPAAGVCEVLEFSCDFNPLSFSTL